MKIRKKAAFVIAVLCTLYSPSIFAYADNDNTSAIGTATLKGEIGFYNYWGEGNSSNYGNVVSTSAVLSKDAQYFVSWQFPENDDALSIHYLILELDSYSDTPIVTKYYPNLEITVDSIEIDGVTIPYQTSENSIDMENCENDILNTRIYFVDVWNKVYQDIPSDITVKDEIKVTFTIQNLQKGNLSDGTSSVNDNSNTNSTSYTTNFDNNSGNSTTVSDINSSDSQNYTPILYGDVDNDGKHTITDAYLTLMEYAKTSAGFPASFSSAKKTRSDVDGDGAVTIQDAYLILRYYAAASAGIAVSPETFFPAAKK